MKPRNIITKLLTITMVVAAGWLQPVEAQTSDGSVRFISYASTGLVLGEKVRLSVANTKESGGTLTLSFSYYLAHESNSWSSVPVYESESIRVPPREIWFSEFSREDLKTEGDPVTQRAQVMVKINLIAPAGSDPDDFPGSLQVMKDEVGESVEPDTKYRLIIVAAERSKLNAPIGLKPGEKLLYSFYNPNEEGSRTVSVTTYTYDSYGNLARQSHPVELRPGHGYIFEIKRDDLPVAGEEKTGRLQVRTKIRVSSMDGSMLPVKLHVSMEHVDRNGSTAGGPYFTGSVTVSDDGFGGYN